jgi:hypothetical protein
MFATEEKRLLPGAFFGSTVELLTIFSLSIFVCAVLYTACAVYDGALSRRRESWKGRFERRKGS